MNKQEIREENEREFEEYGKSMISHSDEFPTDEEMHEPIIKHFQDEYSGESSAMDDYEWHIGHFED